MKIVKRIVGVLLAALPIVGLLLFATNSQAVFDWWQLRDYEPTPDIVELSRSSSFSELGEKLFYVHDPALLNKREFQESCTVGESTIVLGCYISAQRIFVYDVQDERLEGVEQVTAAHEMLHAAYDRLSPKEKTRINALLDEAFNRLDDQRILSTVASYRQKDPSVVPNELHSILGTEVRELSADLEAYYAQYFIDRSIVVGYAERYASEFTNREKQIAAYDAQLSQISGDIARLEAELSEENNALERGRRVIEQTNQQLGAYNELVDQFNQRVRNYNVKVTRVTEAVEKYNKLVEERNAIAFEERALVDAIDTRAIEL